MNASEIFALQTNILTLPDADNAENTLAIAETDTSTFFVLLFLYKSADLYLNVHRMFRKPPTTITSAREYTKSVVVSVIRKEPEDSRHSFTPSHRYALRYFQNSKR